MFKEISREIRSKPKVYVLLLLAHVVVTSLTWRDIRNRTADQVRGPKRVWRVASALNTSNSLLYFVVGRKRSALAGGSGGALTPINSDEEH